MVKEMVQVKEKKGAFLHSFLSLSTFFGAYGSPMQPRRAMLKNNEQQAQGKATLNEKIHQENPAFERLHPMHLRKEAKASPLDEELSLLNIYSKKNKAADDNQYVMQKKKSLLDKTPLNKSNSIDFSQFTKILPARQCQNLRIRSSELTLGKIIGEGGFGKVYEGKLRGTKVAIKKLSCATVDDTILAEFASEIEIMRHLRHPNVCRLLGACFETDNQSIVVEYLSNGSLWTVLRQKRDTITEDLRLSFIRDTVAGMSYLHQFQPPILHRDLKSPNLLLDSNYNIKIADFGLSRVKAQVTTMTGNCGTVQWMAPEVLDNRRYTEKADVFSFGIVLWEIYTAKCPYEGMNQVQVGLGVLNRNIRPSIPRKCSPFMAHLMKACWQRDPKLRPSFRDISKLLNEYTSMVRNLRR